MKLFKKLLPYLLVILLSYFSIRPFLNSGFFPMHDDTQASRVFEMTKSLQMGMFPVRWVVDLGYGLGYPIFNFYAPLSYYIGSFFNLLGFDALTATKIMMTLGILVAGVFMYMFITNLFGKKAGIVAALFYIYAPYHALDIFVRGDVAEFWAYAFIPLVFYGIWKIYSKLQWRFVIITALGFAGVILSHNLTALMITPFILIYSIFLSIYLYKKNERKKIVYIYLSILLGILISVFYWLPAIGEMKNTNVLSLIGGGSNYLDHFVCINQLWSSPWGFGGSAPGCIDGLSLMVGKLNILISLASLILITGLFLIKKATDVKNTLTLLFIFFFFFSLFLTLDYSKIIWQTVSLMAFFQFPWRFILAASFFSAFLSGFIVWKFNNLLKVKIDNKYLNYLLPSFLIIGLIFLNVKFFAPQKYTNVNSDYYTSSLALKWRISKISDEYLPKNIKKPKTYSQALVNKPIFSFEQTPLEKTANFISLAGILVLFLGIIYPRLKK